MTTTRALPLLPLVALAVACGKSPDASTAVPSFQQDIVPLFNQSCGATTQGCHNAAVYASNPAFGCTSWLTLEDRPLGSVYGGSPTGCPDRTLYQRLTALEAWECIPIGQNNGTSDPSYVARHVVPGDPASSYLYRKMTNQWPYCQFDPQNPQRSQPMPPSGLLRASADMVRRWIEAGAPDDSFSSTPSPTPTQGSAPSAPSSLAVVLTAGGVGLSWIDTSANEDWFRVQRKVPGQVEFSVLAELPADSETHYDATVSPATTYVYRVVAGNSAGRTLSNEVTIAVP